MKVSILKGSLLILIICLLNAVPNALSAQKNNSIQAEPIFPKNEWAVQIQQGQSIEDVAASLNAQVVGPIGTLPNFYLLSFNNYNGDALSIDASLAAKPGVIWSTQQIKRQMAKKNWNDPSLGDQWHLNNTGQGGGTAGVDANVFPAWNLGVSGSGVQICIVDDGVERSHSDLDDNFKLADSRDLNGNNGNDPTPNLADSHGTSCAGVAAAIGNNNIGVSGVAYDADLSGVRLIAAANTDADEATALTLNYNNNDIFSNSWGPTDNGVYSSPGPLAKAALEDGALNGRNGLGSIYTWAAGNGRANNDNSNYDGYVNSIYTIGVGAHADDGVFSWYSEPGASMLISAPSNGGTSGITTTATNNGYTNNFGGTSSATPLVSGIIALMLEANPNLTWRDVQHILVDNGTMIDAGNADWTQNGVGKNINHAYGFGGVDAAALVQAAQNWNNVAPMVSDTSNTVTVNRAIPDGIGEPGYGAAITETININSDITLEQVELKVNITHTYRGDLRVRLTSPSGTESILAEQHNDSNNNLSNWYYTTVRNWGENAMGTWTIQIDDGYQVDEGTFVDFQLIVHGTPSSACMAVQNLKDMAIDSDTYEAAEYICSNGTIAASNMVTFQAGDSVVLKPGFAVASGAIFTAKIDDCGIPAFQANASARNSPIKPTTPIVTTIQKPQLNIYPNPVRHQANLALQLPKDQEVSIFLIDAYGRQVQTLQTATLMSKGTHQLLLNTDKYHLQNGIYFIVTKIEKQTIAKKISIIQ